MGEGGEEGPKWDGLGWRALLYSQLLSDTRERGSGGFMGFPVLKRWQLHRA